MQDLQAGTEDAAIVSSTIALSKLLGLSVIAEGVDNAATADLLVSMGCNEGQGYYFGWPVPVHEFEERWLAGKQNRSAAVSMTQSANAA